MLSSTHALSVTPPSPLVCDAQFCQYRICDFIVQLLVFLLVPVKDEPGYRRGRNAPAPGYSMRVVMSGLWQLTVRSEVMMQISTISLLLRCRANITQRRRIGEAPLQAGD